MINHFLYYFKNIKIKKPYHNTIRQFTINKQNHNYIPPNPNPEHFTIALAALIVGSYFQFKKQ
jgi:hypothetical protein